MKVECKAKDLSKCVQSANRIANKRMSLPILGLIVLSVSKEEMKIKATNLEVGLEYSVPAKISKEGVVALDPTTLSGFLSHLDLSENIKIEKIANNVYITTKKSSTTLRTHDPSDFPLIPHLDKKDKKNKALTLSTEKFIDGVNSVIFSASTSEIKPEISSVYIYPKSNEVVFVSTDSFRLSEKKVRIQGIDIKIDSGLILPQKNALEVLRALDGLSGELTICFNNNQISFIEGHNKITSRIIDGTYPDYEQIMPKAFSTETTVLKEELMQAIKMTTIFSDKTNQILLSIDPKENLFEVSSKNQDIGENTVKIDAALEGDTININLNGRYLIEAFSAISDDSITIGFNGPNKAVCIRGVQDNSYKYLVMPLNV